MGRTKSSDLEKEVAGEYNTFRVYLYMLKVKNGSARQVQKALGFSSPWLATHHLEKLESFGLVRKDSYGNYHVVSKSFGILKFFIVSGRWIVPRSIFIVAIFAVMSIGFLVYLPQHKFFIVAFIASVIGLVISVLETVRFYRLLPKTQ